MQSSQKSISKKLSNANKQQRVNNFDLLRFIFAFIVLLVHAHVLSGVESLSVLSQSLSSSIAVKSFFIVSGFLIFMSYENSHNTKNYFLKRVRRIYPAYFVVVFSCAVFGYALSTYSITSYWSLDLLKYIVCNLLFLNFLSPSLPGVFEGNHLQAVNGALWTLKIEVMFYLFVPFAAITFRKFNRLGVILLFYAISILYSWLLLGKAKESGASIYLELQRQLPGQLTYFMAGAAAYYYYNYLRKFKVLAVSFALIVFLFKSSVPWLIFEPVVLAILVVSLAYLIPYLGNFGKYGDFSYGIYIAHFPILQTLIYYGLFNKSPWLALTLSSFLTLCVAFLLWHFIEKPFLRKSSHYVSFNSAPIL